MEPEAVKQIAAEAAKLVTVAPPPNTLLILYASILALFILLPTVIDIIYAYYSRNKNWELLLKKAGESRLDKEELQALIKSGAEGPPGISGMSRSLMAFGVIVILGIAVFHLLAVSHDPQYDDALKNVLSMLAATLASITGFYFGGKSAEQKAAPPAASKPKPGPPAPPPGQVPPPTP